MEKDTPAAKVAALLSALPPAEALAALYAAMGRELARLQIAPPERARPRHYNRERAPWQKFKIERDPEVKEFFLALPGPLTIADIRARIVARFGTDRAPSRRAIGRYLLRIESE